MIASLAAHCGTLKVIARARTDVSTGTDVDGSNTGMTYCSLDGDMIGATIA